MADLRKRRIQIVLGLAAVAGLGLAVAFALGLFSIPKRDEPPPASDGRPRLLVLVVFDQLRGDYPARWENEFGEGGFRRLQKDGAWYTDCHYPFAATLTAAGHATVLTGCSPDKHGIVANDWYDRAASGTVYCVASPRHSRVPAPAPDAKSEKKAKPGVSPDTLKAQSFADALKDATGGKARVVALSFKDRSAILPGGRKPDACYWLDTDAGEFVTSTYYRESPHSWVEAFNRRRPADRWFGMDWTRLRPDLDYGKLSGRDDVAGEGTGVKQGRTFPHPMDGGLKSPGPAYYQAIYTSPFGNELLLDLAKEAIDAEGLGKGEATDLLCVSFTSNDPVGHVWGPDSQEVLDTTLRSDLVLKGLLDHLDATVGKDRYLLALTADHGVCPLPEVARAQGKEAGRIPPALLGRDTEAFLEKTFGAGDGAKRRWVDAASNGWVFLNQKLLRDRGLESAKVEQALADWLKTQPGVLTAYPRSVLVKGVPADDEIGQRVLRSFYPDRCGDVAVVVKPYYLPGSEFATGTTHGSPHPYDTHVPLMVYGPGVRKGVRKERVSPAGVAAIFARAAGIGPPADADTPLPADLFEAN